MTFTTIVILIIIGLLAGMLSGLVGVGGGIIIVPGLVYFLAYSQKTAQGTSLGVLMLPVVAIAAFYYYKSGNMNVKAVPIIALGFIVGGFLGSRFALSLPDAVIKKIFAVVLILIALKMIFLDKDKKTNTQQQATPTNKT